MKHTVRPAEPEDAAAVRSVAEAAWWATYAGIIEPDTIRDAIDDLYAEPFLREVIADRDDVLFLVAERRTDADESEDVPVLGFTTAQQTWADEVQVHTLYVHPDHWGEGTGTALLDAVEESARAADVDRLRCELLQDNHVGRSFLEARGFERVDAVTTEIGDETVPEDVFERQL